MRLLALGVALVPLVAAGQRRDAALDLAIAAVHEAGLRVHEDEVVALHAVIAARARGNPRIQMTRAFAGRTTRPWVLGLRRDGREPEGWPRAVAWSRYRARWLAILETADLAVQGVLSHRCAVTPEAWGGDMDAGRAARLGLVEVPCGSTRNRFYISARAYQRAIDEARAHPPEVD